MRWDGDRERLKERVSAWLRALGISNSVYFIEREELRAAASRVLATSQYFASSLFKLLYSALDVMEQDLKRAGLLRDVDEVLGLVYTASHVGYLHLIDQSARLAGPGDNELFWNRVQGQIMPATLASPVTLLRLEVWKRIEHLYREFVPLIDSSGGSVEVAQQVKASLPLLAKVHERGPMWLWQDEEDVRIMSAVVVRLDAEGLPHCDEGPAIVDPDGTETYAIHGEEK
jgi:hypothetical protein